MARSPRVEEVAREAATLRARLEARGVTDFRSVALEEDTGPIVRTFWESLGWSPAFEALDLVAPERSVGRERAKEWLADAASDRTFRLRLDDLPSPFRVVHMDNAGVGFLIADESTRAKEPRLRAVLWEGRGRIVAEKGSYLRYVAERIVQHLLGRGSRLGIIDLPKGVTIEGAVPFPNLAPDHRDHEGLPVSVRPTQIEIAAPDFDALYEWLLATSLDELSVRGAGTSVLFPLDAEPSVRAKAKVDRTFETPDGGRPTWLGRLGKQRVIAVLGTHFLLVYAADRHALHRRLHGLRVSGPWHAPGSGQASTPFANLAPSKRARKRAFEADVDRFAELAASLPGGSKARVRVPRGLPARVDALARVLATDSRLAELVPPSKAASRRELRATIDTWLGGKLRLSDGWLVGVGDVKEALAKLPSNARLLPAPAGADRSPWGTLFLSDEATGADDPVVVQVVSESPCPCIGDHNTTHMLARWGLRILLTPHVLKETQLAETGPSAFPALCPEVRAVAPGIFFIEGLTYATDLDRYMDFLEQVQPERVGDFGPPASFASTTLKTPPTPERLAELGLRTGPHRAKQAVYRDRATMSSGRIDGHPVFVTRVDFPSPRAKPQVTLYCEARRKKKLVRALAR